MEVFKYDNGSVHVELPRVFGYLPFVSVSGEKPKGKIVELSVGIGQYALCAGRCANGCGVYLSWM